MRPAIRRSGRQPTWLILYDGATHQARLPLFATSMHSMTPNLVLPNLRPASTTLNRDTSEWICHCAWCSPALITVAGMISPIYDDRATVDAGVFCFLHALANLFGDIIQHAAILLDFRQVEFLKLDTFLERARTNHFHITRPQDITK